MTKLGIVTIAALLGFASSSFAIDDTPENRAAQIERYLAAVPPSEMINEMADAVSMNLPPGERVSFREVLTKYLDIDVFTSIMTQGMIKHFTADELKAIADLYSSPIGRSAMSKMGAYMAEVMPPIQAEMLRAFGEAEIARAEANRQLPDAEE